MQAFLYLSGKGIFFMHATLATLDFSHLLGALHAVLAAVSHAVTATGVWPGTAD
jgi:hypothetical protein